MKLHFDKVAMQAEVLKYVSPGMPVENAKRIMEDSGFACEKSFYEGPACVLCSAVYRGHFFSTVESGIDKIHVRLYHESGKVTEIKTECYSVGP